jgi:hypothetical protein
MMTPTWDFPHLLLLWAMWAVMMAGMMLPSASSLVLVYGVAARRSAGAPGCAPAGHSGAGHGHPPSSVPHVTSDETGYLGKRGGGARSARPPAGRGRVGTWESGILRTCLPSTLVRIAFSSFAAMPVKLSMSAQRSIT